MPESLTENDAFGINGLPVSQIVMAVLDTAIHAFLSAKFQRPHVDARVKPAHDSVLQRIDFSQFVWSQALSHARFGGPGETHSARRPSASNSATAIPWSTTRRLN